MLVTFGGITPRLGADAWVAPTATLIGDVELGAGASVWYGVVVRADRAPIRIGERSNVQDNATFHADPGFPVQLGADVTVGHGAIVHGATVEAGSLIGMGATVLNGAVVGAGSLVAAGAVVREGMVIPPGSLVAGVPAKVVGSLGPDAAGRIAGSVQTYEQLRDEHRAAIDAADIDAAAAEAESAG